MSRRRGFARGMGLSRVQILANTYGFRTAFGCLRPRRIEVGADMAGCRGFARGMGLSRVQILANVLGFGMPPSGVDVFADMSRLLVELGGGRQFGAEIGLSVARLLRCGKRQFEPVGTFEEPTGVSRKLAWIRLRRQSLAFLQAANRLCRGWSWQREAFSLRVLRVAARSLLSQQQASGQPCRSRDSAPQYWLR